MNIKQKFKDLVNNSLNSFGYRIQRTTDYLPLRTSHSQLALLLYFKDMFDLVKDVEGDIVECGVGFGHSFYRLCCLAYYEGKDRKIIGFDSFQGFPEPTPEDISPRNSMKGEWNVGSIKTIEQLIIEGGEFSLTFYQNNVKLVNGFFEESLKKFDGRPIALLHLDVDLYQSYKVTLEHFWPFIQKGGVVLFDEYKQPDVIKFFPGAPKAIDEFFGPLVSQIQQNKRVNKYYIVKQ